MLGKRNTQDREDSGRNSNESNETLVEEEKYSKIQVNTFNLENSEIIETPTEATRRQRRSCTVKPDGKSSYYKSLQEGKHCQVLTFVQEEEEDPDFRQPKKSKRKTTRKIARTIQSAKSKEREIASYVPSQPKENDPNVFQNVIDIICKFVSLISEYYEANLSCIGGSASYPAEFVMPSNGVETLNPDYESRTQRLKRGQQPLPNLYLPPQPKTKVQNKFDQEVKAKISEEGPQTQSGNSLPMSSPTSQIPDSLLEGLSPTETQLAKNEEEKMNEKWAQEVELGSDTFINVDVRYFNFKFLVEKLGHFEAILIDPPWRIKGAQRNDTSFMFTNNKFNLEYNTLSNKDIKNLPLEILATKGFMFLWVLNSQLHIGYECMNKWGYEVIDQIHWVKTKNGKIHISHGFYFLHSSETCLIGYKCPPGDAVEFRSKISNNIITGEVRKKSQKPDYIYTLIEMMLPSSSKIEIFARNNNLRKGWLSIGNQLGINYEKWKNMVNCDICSTKIETGEKRFKSKIAANIDICGDCYEAYFNNPLETNIVHVSEMIHKGQDFFKLENQADEDILHEYHQCNRCQADPIWGTRFQCNECEDYDLCEFCFDLELKETNSHALRHIFQPVELAKEGSGLSSHTSKKCNGCFMQPIIGTCFICSECPKFNLCQNCFFMRDSKEIRSRSHTEKHKMELMVEPHENQEKYIKWQVHFFLTLNSNSCSQMPIQKVRYKCDQCFDFDFCEKCYLDRENYKSIYSNSHKLYHTFTPMYLVQVDNEGNQTHGISEHQKRFYNPNSGGGDD